MILATPHQQRHNAPVPFNSGSGIGVPFDIGGQPPSGYFYVRSLPLVRPLLWAGRGRSVLARAGSYVPVRQSCYVLAHPRLASGGLVNTRHRRQTMPSITRALSRLFPISSTISTAATMAEAQIIARLHLARTGHAVRIAPAACGFSVVEVR